MSIEGQCHFLTLADGHLRMKIKLAFLRNHWAIFQPNFECKLVGSRKKINQNHQHNAGDMTKMAAMPIYGKTL